MQFFVMWRSIVLIVLLVVICCCIEAKREESVVEKDTYTGNSDDKVNTPQTVKNEHPVITDQKFYDVLVVTLCLRGHLNPAGGQYFYLQYLYCLIMLIYFLAQRKTIVRILL